MPATNNLSDQFARLRQQRGAMVGLLLLLVIVVFWVALGLFSSQQKFAVPKAMRDLARPLSPVVDEKTLARLEGKRAFSQAELINFTIYKVIVSDTDKQLKLVDISYQEGAEGGASESESKLQNLNQSSAATPAAQVAPDSTPSAQPATTSAIPETEQTLSP